MPESDTPRVKVAEFIEMCDYPCTKQDLLLAAEECQFPDDVTDVCEDLPNKTYYSEDDVMETIERAAKSSADYRGGEVSGKAVPVPAQPEPLCAFA